MSPVLTFITSSTTAGEMTIADDVTTFSIAEVLLKSRSCGHRELNLQVAQVARVDGDIVFYAYL